MNESCSLKKKIESVRDWLRSYFFINMSITFWNYNYAKLKLKLSSTFDMFDYFQIFIQSKSVCKEKHCREPVASSIKAVPRSVIGDIAWAMEINRVAEFSYDE